MDNKVFSRIVPTSFQVVRKVVGLVLVFSAFGSTAFAFGVPEIDPGSASSALGLLVGGLFLLAHKTHRS